MSCIHLIKVDKTPWHGDVFDHPIYEFYCSYTPGDNIKLPHQYIYILKGTQKMIICAAIKDKETGAVFGGIRHGFIYSAMKDAGIPKKGQWSC